MLSLSRYAASFISCICVTYIDRQTKWTAVQQFPISYLYNDPGCGWQNWEVAACSAQFSRSHEREINWVRSTVVYLTPVFQAWLHVAQLEQRWHIPPWIGEKGTHFFFLMFINPMMKMNSMLVREWPFIVILDESRIGSYFTTRIRRSRVKRLYLCLTPYRSLQAVYVTECTWSLNDSDWWSDIKVSFL